MSVTGFNRRRRELAKQEALKYERQSETRPPERQEVKEEPEEAKDEGIELEEMTVNELRELAKAENHTGIYGKSKAELVELLGK